MNREGKRDASGAFLPEAAHWCAVNHGHMIRVDGERSDKEAMRYDVILALTEERFEDCRQIAFFCHGYRSGIQFGFGGKDGAACLAAAIQGCTDRCTVILYACSTGLWFARELARQLGDGYQVWSHDSRGHTTRNPRLVWSAGDGSINVWTGLGWVDRARLRHQMAGDYRLQLGTQTPQRLRETLDRLPSDIL